MKIAHIAIWCKDLEIMKNFYVKYFQATTGKKYNNKTKMFESYFLDFKSGSRLELMHRPNVPEVPLSCNIQHLGLIHIAFGTGSKENVLYLTEELRKDGFVIAGEPRVTGDGYYESVVIDPEGNIIEICDQ